MSYELYRKRTPAEAQSERITDTAISVAVALLVCTLWKVWFGLNRGSEDLYWLLAVITFVFTLVARREKHWKHRGPL